MSFASKEELLVYVEADASTKTLLGDLLWELYSSSSELAGYFDDMVGANEKLVLNVVTGDNSTAGFINDVPTTEHYISLPRYWRRCLLLRAIVDAPSFK